jgi:N-acetylmuramoyl-L-alanine amidase
VLKKDSLQRVRNLKIQHNEKNIFFQNLSKIGYSIEFQKNLKFNKTKFLKNITKAFQRRFRQELINGIVDKECLNISENLVKKIH